MTYRTACIDYFDANCLNYDRIEQVQSAKYQHSATGLTSNAAPATCTWNSQYNHIGAVEGVRLTEVSQGWAEE